MYSQSRRHAGRSVYNSKNHQPRRPAHGQQTIDPSRFIKPAQTPVDEVLFVPQNRFQDFAINDLLKTNIITKGYVQPSPIQDQAIPLGLAGKDIVGIANTGTGKTAAFAIPILNQLINDKLSKVLIIAPARELAQQIEVECRSFAQGSGLKGAVVIGGTSMSAQIRDLRANPSVVIGTPGRLKDHIERGTLNLSNFNIVVLDEVDRMVDMGFINDIRLILGRVNSQRQSYFFSATLDPKLKGLVEAFLNDPVTISVKTGETSDNVHQDVLRYTTTHDKIDKLQDTLIHTDTQKALIFDATQRGVERLNKELQARGFKVDAIHGGKSQGQRQRALARFRQNEINILVATDVAARGIDIVDITHVINYNVPKTYDDYIHRIGRAGRAGRAGKALTFVSN
ncbi:MAG TPA: DEAD/DEAH box helicase [Patescibacteria group bacterium]|nr:DEAD/DEAH box helicase [Patescibacteria group bacterium]